MFTAVAQVSFSKTSALKRKKIIGQVLKLVLQELLLHCTLVSDSSHLLHACICTRCTTEKALVLDLQCVILMSLMRKNCKFTSCLLM